jgi:pimeloyl-ACP methyl ester carboxylesterase
MFGDSNKPRPPREANDAVPNSGSIHARIVLVGGAQGRKNWPHSSDAMSHLRTLCSKTLSKSLCQHVPHSETLTSEAPMWGWLKLGAAAAFGGVAALALAYPAANLFKKELNDQTRAELRAAHEVYSFVKLADGVTHYRLEGTPTKGTVVLIHGILNSAQIYEPYFAPLTAAGYRVLSYDLYGRGYTDRPAVKYTSDLFDRQLSELLDKLDIAGPVHLTGFTIGGPISAIFAERHPERVASLNLVAVSGLLEKHEIGRQAMPIVGDWFYRVLGPWELESYVLQNAQSLPDPMTQLRAYRKWSIYAGHEDAVLETLRSFPYYATREHYARAGKLGIPVFVTWGADDKTYPVAQTEILTRLIPQAQVRVLPGVSHSIVYAFPELVSSILIENLASVSR